MGGAERLEAIIYGSFSKSNYVTEFYHSNGLTGEMRWLGGALGRAIIPKLEFSSLFFISVRFVILFGVGLARA